jgi:hypothetical protein
MYEFHGWFGLAETPHDIDDGILDAAVEELRPLLEPFQPRSTTANVRWHNGQPFVDVQGLTNRPRGLDRDLDALLAFLARRLPGSYGLLYDRDDERVEPPGGNAFRVRVLARGTVTERDDPFLSPNNPVIED